MIDYGDKGYNRQTGIIAVISCQEKPPSLEK